LQAGDRDAAVFRKQDRESPAIRALARTILLEQSIDERANADIPDP
jgi:hypothetical protein